MFVPAYGVLLNVLTRRLTALQTEEGNALQPRDGSVNR